VRIVQSFCLYVLIVSSMFCPGCRAHPVSLAMMVVGDVVNDADVENLAKKLVERNIAEADKILGARLETLEDDRRTGHEMIVYPVKGDVLGTSRYVVEAENGKIVSLTKSIQNIDGAEDLIKQADLRSKLIGKDPDACRIHGKLGQPVLMLRDQADKSLVMVYDVSNVTNLRGARYCILRFDTADKCEKVNLAGVSASTKENPVQP